jgi:DnaK suppressor protein
MDHGALFPGYRRQKTSRHRTRTNVSSTPGQNQVKEAVMSSQPPEKSTRQRTPSEQPHVHPDSDLTTEQAEELQRQLLEMRSRLLRGHEDHLDGGRFATEQVSEPEEAAAMDTSQSTLMDLAENERILLAQVDRALEKLRNATYGVSEESGEPIGFDRLRAIPWATLSVVDQERRERESKARRG